MRALLDLKDEPFSSKSRCIIMCALIWKLESVMTVPILHHFWASPFAYKTRMAMALAELPWASVEIPRIPPKPLLMPLTSGYRRTPVLQVGADIYCDTQNIALVIDELGTAGRLFPNESKGRAVIFSEWVDQTLFPLAVRIVIAAALDEAPKDFIQDRGDLYFGPNWSEDQLRAELPGVTLQLKASLAHLDAAVPSGGYALAGTAPSYADLAVAYVCWFLRGRWSQGAECLSQYVNIEQIESALLSLFDGIGPDDVETLDAEEALEQAFNAEPQSPTGIQIDSTLKPGQRVSVRPFVHSSDPAIQGRLRYLDATRVSIDTVHPEVGSVAIHLPVSGYQITSC